MINKIKQIIIICIIFTLCVLLCRCTYIDNFIKDYQTVKESSFTETTNITTIPTIPSTQSTKTTTQPKTIDITMSFLGDCMLASYRGEVSSTSLNGYIETKDPTYFFEKVYNIISADDFTLANLENVVTDNPLKESYKNYSPAYWFKAPTKSIKILKVSSIEGVSLDNNHFGDYGEQGKQDTIEALNKYGILYGLNDNIIYFEKQGFTVAFICEGLWAESQANTIINRLNVAKEKSDYQVVFFHGGTEKLHKPEEWKVRACYKIVDAGADLVIGGHPHVLQPTEVYDGVNIVYSLGNFCYGGHSKPENATIIYQIKLNIDINTKQVISSEPNIIPCYVFTGSRNNYQPTPITPDTENYNNIMEFIMNERDSPV